VIVRGKANAETEFANTLFLGGTDKWNYPCLPVSVTTDRGFDSLANRLFLKEKGIENIICPKSVPALQKKMQQASFRENQKRRGQTEGRIGILKNRFLGNPLKSKGFASR